ncbi:MAG: rod shape-determining protein RodA [Candidatus Magasanikbacteria bacterium]
MFFRIKNYFHEFEWPLFIAVLILTGIGLAGVYSVDLSRGTGFTFFPTQVTALFLGIAIVLFFGYFHKTVYENTAKYMYILALVSLIAVLFFGTSIRGTRGWFQFVGFSFQPAELAKLALILFLGFWVSRQGRKFQTLHFVIYSAIITGIPIAFILLQPDLGSALVLGGIWFGMLLFVGTKKRYILGLLGILSVIFFFSWFFLFKDYQKDRLLTFFDPGKDPLNSGYNVTQSIIAVGSGKIFGRGLGFGSQSQLHFLPEAQTDFIFAVISEEMGFVGVFSVFILYGFILFRLLLFASRSTDDFVAYTYLGIFLLFFIHISLNIGAAIGAMPLTGITLPFLSYGGSSLVINYFLIAIAMSLSRSTRKLSSGLE